MPKYNVRFYRDIREIQEVEIEANSEERAASMAVEYLNDAYWMQPFGFEQDDPEVDDIEEI